MTPNPAVAGGGLQGAEAASPKGLIGFFKRLAQYYAEFLSTDFKKQRLPRRQLQTADAQGRLVGIPLRKYPGFQQKLWEDLAKPVGAGLSFTVARGSWRAELPKAVVETMAAHIAQVTQDDIDAVITGVMKGVVRVRKTVGDDPHVAFEQFIEEVRAGLSRSVIGPLLDRMEGFFARTENKPVESLHELQDQLSARLANGIETASGPTFSRLLVENVPAPLEALIRDELEITLVRAELESFFATFTAADLYVDLSDLVRSSRLVENADFYLHIGEVHNSGHIFPIFYIPFSAQRTEQGFRIAAEPRLYVNKRAMDYVAQEVAKAEGRPTSASTIRERIFYLAPEQSPVGVAQKLFDDLAGSFNLRADIDFRAPRDQKVSSSNVVVANRLSFSLFDRSDESMVNDYEALLTGIDTGGEVTEFFEALIDDFLMENPVSVRADVDGEWAEMSMPERLVFDSPLPLVEEQRKILSAIRHPDSRFIAVEGPPGTGKSHTITAVAFDLILAGKNLLVLSDKKEALDVVEDKLNQALAKVRPSADFPNPILRLGMNASNYGQLLKKSAIERLQVNQRILRRSRPDREKALASDRAELKKGLEETARSYAQIDVAEIAELERDTATMVRQRPDSAAVLSDPALSVIVEDIGTVSDYLRSNQALGLILRWQGANPRRLNELARIATVMSSLPVGEMNFGPIIAFSIERLNTLERAIAAIEDIRNPVFGYLFASKKLREIARIIREECKIRDCDDPKADLTKLKLWRTNLNKVRDHLAAFDLGAEFEAAVVLIGGKLVTPGAGALVPEPVLHAALRLDEAVKLKCPLLTAANGRFYPTLLENEDGPLAWLEQMGALKRREAGIRKKFTSIRQVDYVGAKTKIESLNTQLLAERIDERLIEFYDHKKNDALALAKIIREKQRFPVDKFADIQRAFPCIIAGLRDYAEFIPLEREIFDLVIIDEASQVSIAQALPAILRAKKVLVLGDRNQFGNVKTTNASREVNATYMSDLLRAFEEDFSQAGQTARTRIDLFNIRSSVLDFIEPISNFAIQLKKHFRSYPEMIGFSSKYFYGDSLQVMKIRGGPIEDVIEFDAIEHDGLIDQRNVNAMEAERIVERAVELLDENPAPTVGVITPHTEQQAFIAKLVQQHRRADELYDKLRLKIMTFDTCQGEEREVLFYSLVATAEKDRLAYIFPSKLDRDHSDEVDHNLRLQRLNVGLSRGQEKIVFVHSKPIDNYSSSLRAALSHYRSELERAKAMPTEDELDESSPMERKVLHWLSQVPLIRDLDGACEVIAQFELGKYLRQLDPTYHHPDYCVDFLIRIRDGAQHHQLVIEYDGFEFHFEKGVPSGMINSSTWRAYLTAEDVEREKVLESFGVQMIRLNRFNLGKDPVATIDTLLRERWDGMLNGRQPHELVSETVAEAGEVEEGLKSGDYKRCKKCDRDLPLDMFRDGAAKSGIGRQCKDCKTSSASGKPRFRRYNR